MKDKFLKENRYTVNHLKSELDTFLSENKNNQELVLECLMRFCLAAKVDSRIIVEALSDVDNPVAKDLIMEIKVTEGW